MQSTNPQLTIGIDIENVDRFRQAKLIKNQLFLAKIFTLKEQRYCLSQKDSASHFAVRFAAKEAVFKALSGLGLNNPDYKKIEIKNNKLGVPKIKITGKRFINVKVEISLSHCQDKAIACAIIYQ